MKSENRVTKPILNQDNISEVLDIAINRFLDKNGDLEEALDPRISRGPNKGSFHYHVIEILKRERESLSTDEIELALEKADKRPSRRQITTTLLNQLSRDPKSPITKVKTGIYTLEGELL